MYVCTLATTDIYFAQRKQKNRIKMKHEVFILVFNSASLRTKKSHQWKYHHNHYQSYILNTMISGRNQHENDVEKRSSVPEFISSCGKIFDLYQPPYVVFDVSSVTALKFGRNTNRIRNVQFKDVKRLMTMMRTFIC